MRPTMINLMIFIFVVQLISQCRSDAVSATSFQVQLNQETTIATFGNTTDVKLIPHVPDPACSLRLKNLVTQIHYQTLLKEQSNFLDFDTLEEFGESTVLEVVSANGALLVLTSERVLYFLKLSYQKVFLQANSNNFTDKVKEANLTDLKQQDHPRMLYLEKSNQALLLFRKSTFIINVGQLENNSKEIQLFSVGGLPTREDQAVIQVLDEFIFIATKGSGLEVYLIQGRQFTHLTTLFNNSKGSNYFFKEIQVLRQIDQLYLYLWDESSGIIVAKMSTTQLNQIKQNSTKIIQTIKDGDIVTYHTGNVSSLYVAYRATKRYLLHEYIFQEGPQTYKESNQISIPSRIKKIRSGAGFLLLQGSNHYQVLFHGEWHSKPTMVTQFGLRDLKFYYPKEHEFFNNLIFGFTREYVFLIKYSIEPNRIVCHATKIEQETYSLIQGNESQQLIVSIVDDSRDLGFYIIFCAAVLGVLLLIYAIYMILRLRSRRQEIARLEAQLKKIELISQCSPNVVSMLGSAGPSTERIPK